MTQLDGRNATFEELLLIPDGPEDDVAIDPGTDRILDNSDGVSVGNKPLKRASSPRVKTAGDRAVLWGH